MRGSIYKEGRMKGGRVEGRWAKGERGVRGIAIVNDSSVWCIIYNTMH